MLNRELILSRMHSKIRQTEQINGINSIEEKYEVAAKLGIIKSVEQKWGSDGFIETPEEMIDYIMGVLAKL